MDRRRYLMVAAGALAGLAGCGTAPSSTTPEATTSRPPTTATEPEPALTVGIETAAYLVRSYVQDPERRAIEPDDIVPLGDVSDPLRSALEAALEGGYTTDEAETELLAQIDALRTRGGGDEFEPYVSVNGTPYAFDLRVPYFEAGLEDAEDPDPDRTVDQDDIQEFAEPAREFAHTIAAFGTNVDRVAYRVSIVPPAVEAFLERYDFVRDAFGTGRIVTERVDPGPPYTIEARELTASDMWGTPVHRAASLPDDLRAFVEAVVASDRRTLVYPDTRTEYRTDDLPAGYDEHLGPDQTTGSGPLVELGGTVYDIEAIEVRREHVPLTVAVAAAGEDAFELTVAPSEAGGKPAIDGPVDLEATWAVPGPLWVLADDARHRLDRVETVIRRPADEAATAVEDAETLSIRPDEELAATYRVPPAVPPGTYRAWGLVRAAWEDAETGRPSPTWPFPFKVVLTLPET